MRTRTRLLGCLALHVLCVPAAAQGLPDPRQTFSLAVGVSDDGRWSGDGGQLVVSGTYELPVAETARIRVEAGRTRQSIRGAATWPAGDTAHLSRLTIGLAALRPSLAPLVPYGGIGFGVYRATFDRAPGTRWRRGANAHLGIEVQATTRVTVAGEAGVHVVPRTLYPEGALFGELLVRVKLAL